MPCIEYVLRAAGSFLGLPEKITVDSTYIACQLCDKAVMYLIRITRVSRKVSMSYMASGGGRVPNVDTIMGVW